MSGESTEVTVTLAGGGPEDGRSVSVPKRWTAYRPRGAQGAYVKGDSPTVWRWKPDPR